MLDDFKFTKYVFHKVSLFQLDFSIKDLNEEQLINVDWNVTVMNGWVR